MAVIRLKKYYDANKRLPADDDALSAIGNLDVLDDVFFMNCYPEIKEFTETFGKSLTVSDSLIKRFMWNHGLSKVKPSSAKRHTLLELRPGIKEFHIKMMLLALSGKIDIRCVINGDETSHFPYGVPIFIVTKRGRRVSIKMTGNEKYRNTVLLGVGSTGTMLDSLIIFPSMSQKAADLIEKMKVMPSKSQDPPTFINTETHSFADSIPSELTKECYFAEPIQSISLRNVLTNLNRLTKKDLRNHEILKKNIFSVEAAAPQNSQDFSGRSSNADHSSRPLASENSLRRTRKRNVGSAEDSNFKNSTKSGYDRRRRSAAGDIVYEDEVMSDVAQPIPVRHEPRSRKDASNKKKSVTFSHSSGECSSDDDPYEIDTTGSVDPSLSIENFWQSQKECKVTGLSRDPETQAIISAKPLDNYEDPDLNKIYERLLELVYEKFQRECCAPNPKKPATDVLVVTYQEAAWSCDRIFLIWLHYCVLPKIKDNLEHSLVIVDNFRGHATDRVLRYCFNQGINIMFLPPHATAYSQPLDIGCNKPFKKGVFACRNKQNYYVKKKNGKADSNDKVGFSLFTAHIGSESISCDNIRNSFRHMFVYPGSSYSERKKIKEELGFSTKK